MTVLLPIFADQLTKGLASLASADRDRSTVLMMEVGEEADHVWHHRKKLVFLFSAMRHFAADLSASGWRVRYVTLDDPANTGSFDDEIARAAKELEAEQVELTEPGEWRVEQMARSWEAKLGIPVTIHADTRFLCARAEFADWARGRKELRMEFFYREMRRKTGLLMDGDQPVGGRWNFDSDNRKPADRDLFMPRPFRVDPDRITREVIEMVERRFGDRFGDIKPFWFCVDAAQAEKAARHFLDTALHSFGDFQDAMLTGEDFLYHSVLSLYLNAGFLDPLELCRQAEAVWLKGRAPLNSVEGFVRQIIGWREYVRGIYWLKMPGYLEENVLRAGLALPRFYWTGETKMHCVAEVVRQTRRNAYAHHIQRLMITGNFALVAGIDPFQVHEWYLAVYADAFEWVEAPNTLGMSQYADGGLLASKPYASSGAYINRMSDYCSSCAYDVGDRTGNNACPFNALYWDFLDRNRKKLEPNRRLAMPYRNLERMSSADRRAISLRAATLREMLANGDL